MSNKNEIAVSSVAAFNPEGKLLFGLRTDAQKWTLPGGHANDGEAPEACAERELYEEAGLKPKMLLPVGEGRVPLQGGEDIRVTAFVAMVEGEPTAENDPDSEIEEFRWVDVSKGLPHQIADNLFAPMNVVLRILGLQQGKLLKTEAEEREIVSSYFGDAQPQWWDLLNTLSSFTNIPDAGRRTIARILLTEGQYKPLIENMRMGAHFDLGRVLDRVVNAQREVMEKRHLPKSNTTDGRSIMRMLISGRHNIASMYDAMSEEDDYDDLTPEQLETKAKDLLRQADGIRENGATGNIFPKFDNPEEADRAEMAISLDNETAGRGPAFRQAVQRYMQIVQDTASLSAQDTVNEINAWQKLRAEFPEVQETMGHIAGVGTRLLFYQTLLMKRRQAEAFFANPETYTDPAKRTEMMQRLSSSEAMSPKALKQVVQHAQAPEVLKAVRHDKANDDVYRAALERDWSNTEDGMKREIIDTLVYARRRPSNDSKYMSDSTTQFMVDKYDKTFRQIFLHNMSWLTPSAYIKYITDPDIIATHPLGALSAVSQNKEFFDKHGDDIIDAVLKAKEKAVDEDTDHFIRSNAGVALNWIQNKSASKASALRVFNAWPEVAAPLIARRGDLDSHDIYRFVDWARYNPEASSSVGYLFGKNPDARPEHLLRLLDPLLQRTAKNCVIAITQRAEEPERQKLFNREVCERVLSWPDPIARGHMLQENVGAYVPKDLLDRAISTETDGRALQGLAFNKLADLHTLGAYMAGHMEKQDDDEWPGGVPMRTLLDNLTRRMKIPDQLWMSMAQHPNPNFREKVALHHDSPTSALRMLLHDPNDEVRESVYTNPRINEPELLPSALSESDPRDLALNLRHIYDNARSINEVTDAIKQYVVPRAMMEPQIAASILAMPAIMDRSILDQLMSSPVMQNLHTMGALFANAHRYGEDTLTQAHYDKLFEHILSQPAASDRGILAKAWAQLAARDDTLNPSEDQMRRLVAADMATPPETQTVESSLAPALAYLLERRQSGRGRFNFPEDALAQLSAHQHPNVNAAARARLGPTNPDILHKERVAVRFDTGKLRAIRDLILESGSDSVPANKLPPMEWEVPVRDEMGNVVKRKVMKRSGKEMKEVEEIVKRPLPVRDAKGNISASMIQSYIDSLPAIEFNVSHGKAGKAAPETVPGTLTPAPSDLWTGGQRHNEDYSKVFQLNITNKHVQAMRAKGSWQSYRNQAQAVHSTGHPVRPEQTTIGWIRYTGTPQEGIHIDEIQSDFGQSFVRRAVAEAKERAEAEAKARGLTNTYDGNDEYNRFVQDYVKQIRSMAESKWPDEHNKHIAETVFGGRHSNEVIHEAFHQYLRDRGFHGAKIAIFTPESKAPLSGMTKDKELPAHMKHTYGEVPKKMGYKPSTYGKLPTQNGEDSKSAWATSSERDDSADKWKASNQTWETVIRKYEVGYGLDCHLLAKEEDLAEMARRQFDSDTEAKWHQFYLNPEQTHRVCAALWGSPVAAEESKFTFTAPFMLKVFQAHKGDTMDWVTLVKPMAIHANSNDHVRSTLWDEIHKDWQPDQSYKAHSLHQGIEALVRHGGAALRRKMLNTFQPGTTEGGERYDKLMGMLVALDNFDGKTAKLLWEETPRSMEWDSPLATRLGSLIEKGEEFPSSVKMEDEREWQEVLDKLGRYWANKASDTDDTNHIANLTSERLRNIMSRTARFGSLETARHIMTTPQAQKAAYNFMRRRDVNERDIQNVLDSGYINFTDRDDLAEMIVGRPAFNKRHADGIFDGDDSILRLNVLRYADPKLIDPKYVQQTIDAARDGTSVRQEFSIAMARNLLTPEQIDQVIDHADIMSHQSYQAALSTHPGLTDAHIHKLLQNPAFVTNRAAILEIKDHPSFRPEHYDTMRKEWFKKGADSILLRHFVESDHVSAEELKSLLNHNNPDVAANVAQYALKGRKVFEEPELVEHYLKQPSHERSEWSRKLRSNCRELGDAKQSSWPIDLMKRVLSDPAVGDDVMHTHAFSDDMLRWIAGHAPLSVIDRGLRGHHVFPMDARHVLFDRVQDTIDHEAVGDGPMDGTKHAADLMNKMIEENGSDNSLGIKDLTSGQLSGLIDKYNSNWRCDTFLESAMNHRNMPAEKIREIAQWKVERGSGTRESLQKIARNRIGLEDPDVIHSERVHLKFDLGKARRIRDLIQATGQEELRPKEIPHLPNNWKIGRNPKNGNINAKMIDEEIEKTPTSMYNISHSEYGEERKPGSSEDRWDTCNDCDGTGNITNEGECGQCEGTGRPGDQNCERCDSEGTLPCSTCDGGNNEPDHKNETGECASCDGSGKSNETCDYCEGNGTAPPPCGKCNGVGEVHNRVAGRLVTCPRCDGAKYAKCDGCDGNGNVSEEEECQTCDGRGDIQNDDYEDPDTVWQSALDAQQHNLKASQVVQVNFTTDQVKKMRESGVWDTFRNMYEAYQYTSHPVTPTTIGWIRYTYGGLDKDSNHRYYIDEIQSDFGQSFVRQALNQGIEEGMRQASTNRLQYNTPEWAEFVRDYAEKAKKMAEAKWPEAHHQKIAEVLFGKTPTGKDRHSNEVLFESFFQHLRDKGHHNAIVTMPHLFLKANNNLGRKIGEVCKCGHSSTAHKGHGHFDNKRYNLLNPSRACDNFQGTGKPARTDAPGHYNVTYLDLPIANGMDAASYGESGNPDEDNPKLHGQPTFKGPVRKYEDEFWGVPSRNLHKVDPFEDCEWTSS